MRNIETVFLVGLSFIIRALGAIIIMGIIFFGFCLLRGEKQGVFVLTIGDNLKLLASAIFLFWISLRLMMFGQELYKKYN